MVNAVTLSNASPSKGVYIEKCNLFGEVDLNFVTIMLFIELGVGMTIGGSNGTIRNTDI